MRTYFLLILILTTRSINAQVWMATQWIPSELPSKDSIDVYVNDEHVWYVVVSNGNITATTDENEQAKQEVDVMVTDSILTKVFRIFPAGRRSFVKVKDGVLVGVHNGVYRGGLWWIASDLKSGYQITSQKILKFVKVGDKVFALQDFPNLEVSKGNIIVISGEGDKYISTDYYELPSAPVDAISVDDNSMVVVTAVGGKLIRVYESGEVSTMVSSGLWEDLMPTNVVKSGEAIYLGMRKGIYKYDLKNKTQEWLMPSVIKRKSK